MKTAAKPLPTLIAYVLVVAMLCAFALPAAGAINLYNILWLQFLGFVCGLVTSGVWRALFPSRKD